MSTIFRYLVFMLRIRRVEFRIAEIPILAIPVLLLAENAAILRSVYFWEGVFIFFFLFAFGDMINCLADRDLDAVYKPHLSEAVYGLGLGFVRFQIGASALLAFLLSLHLSWTLDRWTIAALTVAGLVLGAAYSVEPFRLKGRGPAQLICLWAVIFVGPMLLVSQLISAEISPPLIVLAAFYGIVQMGIILVNTAEDYPEDLAAGVRTTVVTLGLRNGITLAFWMAVFGTVGTMAALVWFFTSTPSQALRAAGLLPVLAAGAFVVRGVLRLKQLIARAELPESIATVKKAGKLVPLWVTVFAWSVMWSAGVYFYAR